MYTYWTGILKKGLLYRYLIIRINKNKEVDKKYRRLLKTTFP